MCRPTCPPAPRWPCSAATGPANRRCCASWPRCCVRTPARCSLFGQQLPRRAFAVRGRIGLLAHEPLLYRDLSGRENLRYHARPARDRARAGRAGPGGRADGAARRRPGAPALPRDGAARWRSAAPSCTARACCCSTSRARTSTRPPSELVEPLIGRASGAHARADQPRPAGGAGRGRPGAGAQGRADRRSSAPGAGSARAAQGALRVRTALIVLRKDLRLELRTLETVPAMALFSRDHVRDLPLRPEPAERSSVS